MNLAGRFNGNRPIVYVAYSDESGSGDLGQQPTLIVAAIVINPVSQWSDVQNEMERLVQECVPEEYRASFEFHAHKLFRQTKDSNYERLLTGLFQIPFRFRIPIYFAGVDREGIRQRSKKIGLSLNAKGLLRLAQGVGFYLCAQHIEVDLRTYASDERLLWIADRTEAATAMKDFLRFGQKEALIPDIPVTKLNHVIDTIYFGDSAESRALQLADACNYVIRRHLNKKQDVERYYRIIEPQLRAPRSILYAPES